MSARRHARLASVLVLVAALFAGSSGAAHAASCTNPPDGQRQYWAITNVQVGRAATGLYSNWVVPRHGPFTITYNRTATSQTSAQAGFATTAEAGAIFAKASVQINASVGRTWSKSDSWSYAATVSRDANHRYRLAQFQETRTFRATLKRWQLVNGRCAYANVKAGNARMPLTTARSLTWTTQKQAL